MTAADAYDVERTTSEAFDRKFQIGRSPMKPTEASAHPIRVAVRALVGGLTLWGVAALIVAVLS